MTMIVEKTVANAGQSSAKQELDWSLSSAARRTRKRTLKAVELDGLWRTKRQWTLSFTSPKRVLILGVGKCAESLDDVLCGGSQDQYEMVGFVDEVSSHLRKNYRGKKILGTYEKLPAIVNKYGVTTIVVCVEAPRGVLPFSTLLGLKASGVDIIEGPKFQETLQRQLPLFHVQPSHLVFEATGSRVILLSALKRSIDVVGAAILLILLAPLFAILISILKIESSSPLCVRTLHEGRYGCSFGLWEFRVPGVANSFGSKRSMGFLQRVFTWTGRVCVAWHLTALPQLLHVLLGQMSLVGPRAMTLSSAREANEGFSYYRLRQTVRPGLTGWAQTQVAMASSVTQDELEYDLYYIRHLSCLFDLRIMVKTISLLLPNFPLRF